MPDGEQQKRRLPGGDWIVLSAIIIGLVVASYAGSKPGASETDTNVRALAFVLDFLTTAVIYGAVGFAISAAVRAYQDKKRRVAPAARPSHDPAASARLASAPDLQAQPPRAPQTEMVRQETIYLRLRQLDNLHMRGVITGEERDEQRRRILNEI